jgi:hypothetical protein
MGEKLPYSTGPAEAGGIGEDPQRDIRSSDVVTLPMDRSVRQRSSNRGFPFFPTRFRLEFVGGALGGG